MVERAEPIHGDLSQRAVVRTAALDWQPSPSPSVHRKRLHLVGGAESGQVTSIVRYDAGSRFPSHAHPDGEEILVLDGVFSDEHGDWPAGTYLLNPEGFEHAPFSRAGCTLFVKLRQYAGEGREHVVIDTRRAAFGGAGTPGVETLSLYENARFPDSTRLERWGPGALSEPIERKGGAEILVLEGALEDEAGRYERLTWLRLPDGATHAPRTSGGCLLYVKEGALPSLRSQPAHRD